MNRSLSHYSIPNDENSYLVDHIRLLSDSLQRLCGCGLIDAEERDVVTAARRLYFAPFALLSHGIEADPVINYANHTAQQIFEMDWDAFTKLPSRLSAETALQAERAALLKRVSEQGFIDDYSGIRIASSGRRFRIEDATVWNVVDGEGVYRGQAAMFSIWHDL